MTLIVGLKCEGAVIIGSEEEEVTGFAAKRKVPKLSLIKGVNWAVTVGAAGDSAISENAMRRIDRALEGVTHLTGEHLSEVIDDVLSTVYQKYIDPDPKSEGVRIIVGASCSDGLHLICTQNRTAQFMDNFAFAGYGSDIAIYFLDRLYDADDKWEDGLKVVGFVLFQAKESSQFCGGESNLIILQMPPDPRWRCMGEDVPMELDNHSRMCDFPSFIKKYMKSRRVYYKNQHLDYQDEHNPEPVTQKMIEDVIKSKLEKLNEQQ